MGHEATRSTPTADLQLLLLQQREAIMALTLPQPELPVFTGDPIEYCDFIRAFENLVERKTSSSSARLLYKAFTIFCSTRAGMHKISFRVVLQ